MTAEQRKLIELVKSLTRRSENAIEVGVDKADIFGRSLKLDGRYLNDKKNDLNEQTKELLKVIRGENETAQCLKNEIMWYDVRSLVWKENPNLSVLMALAYADVLIERTGKKDGHIINIATDCYPKHFDSMSVFADTLIRTGIVKNGGGIIYWGVQNGGAIRNYSEFQRAITSENGSWVYGTMSHRAEDFVGAKFGMFGKVFCGEDLMKDMYGKLMTSELPSLLPIENPNDFAVTVHSANINNIDICEDLIRARTGTQAPKNELLAGLKLGFNASNSPIGHNLVDILQSFGADVLVENGDLDQNFSKANIVDPNEHESEPILKMKKMALENGRTYLAVDPDGDRATVIALNKQGEANSLTGTELLLIAAENLAAYNPNKLDNHCIYDMRTGISALLLEIELNKRGLSTKFIAAEPGYPFFMLNMSKFKSAVIAIENSNHPFLTPLTNPIWGAPKYYPGVQGGDDAAIFLVYILGICKHLSDGRNPIEQLDHIRETYNIPRTIIREYKPSLDKKDASYKYDIAKEMCEIAKEKFTGNNQFEIDTMNSGVRITDLEAKAMVLVRYSNTGPAFTASGEAITKENSNRMFMLGASIMREAVKKVQKKTKSTFDFHWNDFEKYSNL